jgi:hypothetical protein
MFSIWRHREFSCYKIMFVMGALDMGCLLICGIATGWLTATGAVYCSAPTLIYGMGIAINGELALLLQGIWSRFANNV